MEVQGGINMTFREFIKENRSRIANTENPKLVARDLYLLSVGYKLKERQQIMKDWVSFIKKGE